MSEDEFRHDYLERNRPVIITGALSAWPANTKWGRNFFSENFGNQELHVKLGQNGIFEGPESREKWKVE